ncbi:PGAP1-like protein-domain-containing protein [Cokeromyces recurvatus]|uniref:PGAP1-like protein-domain-containing protein n=1 Tax=Cokeromyces recurvatus TaxID=90255 RepID=UPI002220FB74|nr:PGAP1-like protein-domain-containing protein [Cokeromyces recurvatus]KAI7899802.1 PGAP1-like protein-domain-containing protein [Cokeromyces recurvatus]
MTYSYPTFIKIDSPSSSFSKKYTLYLYREGYLDDPDKLYGVPALFIPGQAGSYKQIRSLASTTARKKQKIDFFTVDLNEELSALSGQTLLDQAEYMNSVVERILSLYDTHTSSVIIIGHSMGGLIARTMFMLPNYVPNSVRTILTLATPHLSAPLLLDATIYKVYKDLTRYWRSDDHYKASLRDVIVISIAGGSLDNIIHSDGVNTASIIPTKHGFTTYTTSIPGVWTGVDHMAILWCNQLVRLLATTLLDIADLTTLDDRMGMLKYHLLEGGQYATIESQRKHLILPNTQKWQFLTNIDKAYDRCWSIAFCKKPMNNSNDFHCQQTTPHVTVLPSATAENLIEAKPYRLLTVDSGEDYSHLAVIKHCQIVNTDETPFIKAYAIFSQSIQYTQSVWGNYNKSRIL